MFSVAFNAEIELNSLNLNSVTVSPYEHYHSKVIPFAEIDTSDFVL